jgi:hypothetical protein
MFGSTATNASRRSDPTSFTTLAEITSGRFSVEAAVRACLVSICMRLRAFGLRVTESANETTRNRPTIQIAGVGCKKPRKTTASVWINTFACGYSQIRATFDAIENTICLKN